MNREAVELLLVEDLDEDAELTLRALRRKRITNEVLRLRDGAEALDYLFSEPHPDRHQLRVILLDLKLPKVDGLEVLRKLKSHEATRSIPVVVLTSSREDRDLAEAYRLGANSYIVKPVDFGNFAAAVEQLGLYWTLLNQTQAS